MEVLEIPNGCCENTTQDNLFRVSRKVVKGIPQTHKQIKILMGSGFMYNGEITSLNNEYVYFYLY